MASKLKITLKKGLPGKTLKQRETVRGLGLRRRGHTVIRENTPSVRGMVKKIIHMLCVEETD